MNRSDLDRLLNDPLQFRLYVITYLERHETTLRFLKWAMGLTIALLGGLLGVILAVV